MRFVIILFLFLISQAVSAQREVDENTSWGSSDRFYTGIGFGGLSFGQNDNGRYFSIGGSVLGGYMITKNLSTGVGFEYQYTSYGTIKVKQHLYSGYPFVRYNIKQFFIQAEYSLYSVQIDDGNDNHREMFDRLFVGAGYSSPINDRVALNFMLSYDLLYLNSGPFSSPFSTRVFITF